MRFAVGYLNCFDNDLIIEIVEAENFRKAILEHSSLKGPLMQDWAETMPTDIEDIKAMFFDSDSSIDVVEIPEEFLPPAFA